MTMIKRLPGSHQAPHRFLHVAGNPIAIALSTLAFSATGSSWAQDLAQTRQTTLAPTKSILSTPAGANATAHAPRQIEEIMVTARLREEPVQNVPVSIPEWRCIWIASKLVGNLLHRGTHELFARRVTHLTPANTAT